MKTIIFFLLLSLYSGSLIGQIHNPGLPYSRTSFCPNSIKYASIPNFHISTISRALMLAENESDISYVNRISKGVQIDISLDSSGIWNTLPNGDSIWRMDVSTIDALGLTLIFDDFNLSPGCELFVYDTSNYNITMAFDHLYNLPSHKRSIRFTNNKCRLELYKPAGVVCNLSITNMSVQFEVICNPLPEHAPMETCYSDVLCSNHSDYHMVSKSVVKLLIIDPIGNEYDGSGFFVNSSCNDGRPLILTAFHNISGGAGDDCEVSSTDEELLSSFAIVFDCARPPESCNDNSVEVTNYTVVEGMRLISSCPSSDMAILEVIGSIPSSIDFYLSGWDGLSSLDNLSSVSIHHSFGFPKKISYDSSVPSISVTADPMFQNSCLEIGRKLFVMEDMPENQRFYAGGSGSPLFWTTTKNAYGILSHAPPGGLGEVCPTSNYEQTIHFTSISDAIDYCDFENYLSPENLGLLSWSGMWFGDRENTCNIDYWDPANNGSDGWDYAANDCINIANELSPPPQACSFSDISNQEPVISGREFTDASRHLKAQLSLTTGVDGNGNGVLIQGSSNVVFHAYDFVELGEGFVVEEGAYFEAEAHYCCSGWDWSEWRLANPNALETTAYYAIDRNSDLSHIGMSNEVSTLIPNPTTGLITYSGTAPLASATVMDLTGRALYSQPCNGSNSISIDLSPFRPGIYLLRVQYQNGKMEVHRVVRQ